MSESALDKLLRIASPEIGDALAQADFGHPEVEDLLIERNGFSAFYGALRVFPLARESMEGFDLAHWNQADWRELYGEVFDENFLTFAENALGEQWAQDDRGSVFHFNPEVGVTKFFAESLEGWADNILTSPEVLTAWPMIQEFQEEKGEVLFKDHLVPITPFFLGGAYHFTNLYSLNRLEAMQLRGELWLQTKDLPDGTSLEISAAEEK